MPHQCTNCGETFADGSKQMLSGCPECGGNKFQFQPRSSTDATASDQTPSAASPQPVDPSPASDDNSTDSDRGSVAETAAKARSSVREWVGNRRTDDDSESASADVTADPTAESTTSPTSEQTPADATQPPADAPNATSDADADDQPGEPVANDQPGDTERPLAKKPAEDTEDYAQASARSDVVTPEELSAARKSADAARGTEAATHTSPSPDETEGTVIEPSSDDRPDLAQLREELNDQFESIKILSPGQYELNLMELYDRDEYIISLREDGRYIIEVADSWNRNSDEK